jgi:YHS domain-containing protein
MIKKVLVFLAAVAISLTAAMYRWDDSGHAIGLIKAKGGEARHPVSLVSGNDRYLLIATATVIPPYAGSARVELKGRSPLPHTIELARPVVDLGLRHSPRFSDGVLHDLRPRDRIALWVKMNPPKADPVCGMACEDGFERVEYRGTSYCLCGDACRRDFEASPEKYRGRDVVRGNYTLAFTDTATGRPVLNVPIKFMEKGEAGDGNEHQH